MTADNAEQQAECGRLLEITNRRLALLESSVQLKRSGSANQEEQAQLRQQIIDMSAEMDSLLQKMQDAEQKLLDERRLQSDRLFRVTGYILGAAFLLTLGLFSFHYRLMHAELRAREQAEASLRGLSVRLLELQDQERRRFSRELHDSLGQYLVGVKMNLTMLGNSIPANSLVSESMKLLDEAMTETRTISHLLHPPLLDETGFASAARWYVEGFASRSGIQHPPGSTGRPWPPARTSRVGAVPGPAGKPDQCSSPFQESQGGCFAARVSQRSRASGSEITGREFRQRFWSAFARIGRTAAWAWRGCGSGSTSLAESWRWIRTDHGTQILVKIPRSERRNILEVSAD